MEAWPSERLKQFQFAENWLKLHLRTISNYTSIEGLKETVIEFFKSRERDICQKQVRIIHIYGGGSVVCVWIRYCLEGWGLDAGGAKFPTPFQTRCGAYTTLYKMSLGLFP
jgi:hypothetical protein